MERNSVNGFVFYRSFYECSCNLCDEDFAELFKAVFQYAFDGRTPQFSKAPIESLFCLMKPNVDKAISRYISKCNNAKKNKQYKEKDK